MKNTNADIEPPPRIGVPPPIVSSSVRRKPGRSTGCGARENNSSKDNFDDESETLSRTAALAGMTDADLLEAWVRDEHREALSILVQRYTVMVLSVCRRRCRTADDVEDAYQSTFLYLAHNGHTIRHAERLPGWLHRVAQRAANATLKQYSMQTQTMTDTPDDPTDPLTDISRQHEAIVLDEALSELPEVYRSVIVMQMHEECSLQRLAESFQTSVGVIRGRLHRGKKRLARMLRQRGIVPIAAFAAASASMANRSHASEAAGKMNDLISSPQIPDPSVDMTSLHSLFSTGANGMTAYSTGAGVLAAGTLVAALTLLPQPGQADEGLPSGGRIGKVITMDVPEITGVQDNAVVAQFGPAVGANENQNGEQSKSSEKKKGKGQKQAQASAPQPMMTVTRRVAGKLTSPLSETLLEAMEEEVSLAMTVQLKDLGKELEAALGFPVMMDYRGVEFANADLNLEASFEYENLPLRTVLRKMLAPLGLKANIENEGLVVTADHRVLVHRGIGVTQWINVDDAKANEILAKMSDETDFEFIDTPLEDVIEFLNDAHDLSIQINPIALEEIGLSTDTPITYSCKNLTLRDALVNVLSDVDLTCSIRGNRLTITTIEDAEMNLLTRFYWLEETGLGEDYDSLMNLIQTTTVPDTWEALGGPSTMSPYPSKRPALLISSTLDVHLQVESLIRALRENQFGPKLETEEVQVPVPPVQGMGGGLGGGMGGMGGGFGGGMGMGGGGMGGGGGVF